MLIVLDAGSILFIDNNVELGIVEQNTTYVVKITNFLIIYKAALVIYCPLVKFLQSEKYFLIQKLSNYQLFYNLNEIPMFMFSFDSVKK